MPSFFYITLCDPKNLKKEYVLTFKLNDSNIAVKWQQCVLLAKQKYKIDDPQRFYGLNDIEQDTKIALNKINNCIKTINLFANIIDRDIKTIDDQDTLNYLHHIFEVYHGLLGQQNTDFWHSAPKLVQEALADLNISVHRIESVSRGNLPRFVVTYFGLPKTQQLTSEDFNDMTDAFTFGGLYLNYVEIGKTLEDLMKDQDQYIHDDAFRPWNYFSADFNVTLYDTLPNNNIKKCLEYFKQHRTFFESKGYTENDYRLQPGKIKVGQLIYENKEDTFNAICKHQYVKSVDFIL
jgi:hypothetical protein